MNGRRTTQSHGMAYKEDQYNRMSTKKLPGSSKTITPALSPGPRRRTPLVTGGAMDKIPALVRIGDTTPGSGVALSMNYEAKGKKNLRSPCRWGQSQLLRGRSRRWASQV